MENINGQKDIHLRPTPETDTKKPLRVGSYILVLILGILVAKGLFVFLDRSPRSLREDKIESKIKPAQPVKPALVKPASLQIQALPSIVKVPQAKATHQTASPTRQISLPELHLSGIASSGSAGWAIINGKIVKVGDKIKDAKVIRIYGDRVELELEGEIFTLHIK